MLSMTSKTVSFYLGCMKYVYTSIYVHIPLLSLSLYSDLIHGEVVDVQQKEDGN